MLKHRDQVPETGKSIQKLPEERGFLAGLRQNGNGFRYSAGSKYFFSILLTIDGIGRALPVGVQRGGWRVIGFLCRQGKAARVGGKGG